MMMVTTKMMMEFQNEVLENEIKREKESSKLSMMKSKEASHVLENTKRELHQKVRTRRARA
eukprot:585304-Hanusia_phi.AAC.1